MNVVHLTVSPFFGGPERQMLGLARSLSTDFRSFVWCFPDRDTPRAFLEQLQQHGIDATRLQCNWPRVGAALRELIAQLRSTRADVLLCHGYKAIILGWPAARLSGIPIVAVSRGWTGATRRVQMYEALERRVLRRMDAVICVSAGQAAKVRAAGVAADRVHTIRNAIDAERFAGGQQPGPDALRALFSQPPQHVVYAAGRLSPEKGFDQLIQAAGQVAAEQPSVGFVVFGDGPLREQLAEQIVRYGVAERFVLAGHRTDLDQLLPFADIVAIPSFTEGLPNVALEACAAGIPIVATAVGGNPEIVENGVNGCIVPPGDAKALAESIATLIHSRETRVTMGQAGRRKIENEFTFHAQAQRYQKVLRQLAPKRAARALSPVHG